MYKWLNRRQHGEQQQRKQLHSLQVELRRVREAERRSRTESVLDAAKFLDNKREKDEKSREQVKRDKEQAVQQVGDGSWSNLFHLHLHVPTTVSRPHPKVATTFLLAETGSRARATGGKGEDRES